MASSPTIELVDVEEEFNRNEFYRQLLDHNFFHIPQDYYRHMVKTGFIH